MTAADIQHKASGMSFGYRLKRFLEGLIPHLILLSYAVIVLFPIIMILMNSFKARKAIFGMPFQFPNAETFSLIGYETVLQRANFQIYFMNSIIVTVAADTVGQPHGHTDLVEVSCAVVLHAVDVEDHIVD